MKNLLTMLLGVSLLFFVSCGDDDEDFLAPMVGTWDTFSIVTSGCTVVDENGTSTCVDDKNLPVACVTITIKSDGTYTLIDNLEDPAETQSGMVTVTATMITICETGIDDCEPDLYVLTGDTFSVTFTDEDSSGCLFAATFTKR